MPVRGDQETKADKPDAPREAGQKENHVYGVGGFPGGSKVKNLPADVGGAGSIPGSGRLPGGGHANPLVFLPGESHGWRSLAATVHGVLRVRYGLVTNQLLGTSL